MIVSYISIVNGFESMHPMDNTSLQSDINSQSNINVLRYDEVILANTVRKLINSLCRQKNNCKDIISLLKLKVTRDISIADSSLGNRILKKLTSDSTFVKHCLYVADLKSNWQSKESEHFIFYFNNTNHAPDSAKMHKWDNHFERLANIFDTKLSEKIPFKIDKNEKYGRCFAPWEVRWGIRQGAVGSNTHELVHIMLFKTSDVPFFHEPLAFIYGTYNGDLNVAAEKCQEFKQIIADSGYVSAAQLLHFPQIIGLKKNKWASTFYFIYNLLNKFDIDKLLLLMESSPWESSAENFMSNFYKIYGIELSEFESEIINKP